METESSRLVFMTASCIIMAVALSACCGFKVFVPPLILSIFARAGLLGLSENFAWLGSGPAMAVFALATTVETLAYFVPGVNNALDVIKVPAAAIAGILIASAAMSPEISPVLRWTLAVIAGGGAAAAVSVGMAMLRGPLTLTTAGIGSGLQNLAETVLSFLVSIFALLAPFLLCLAVLALLFTFIRRKLRRRALQQQEPLLLPPEQ